MKMAKTIIIPYLLYFTPVFLCFLPTVTSTTSSTIVSKDQITCTMCDTCENPCQPPVVVASPPPPPPALPPPAEPQCPPPPSPSSSGVYYYSPPPPPPQPPVVRGGSGGGSRGGCDGCYDSPSPPNQIVPYFPFYYNCPPPPNHAGSNTITKMNSFVASFLILLPLILS